MDAERLEFSDYVNSLWRRRRLMLGIWIPTVLLTLVLALGLPSKYGSTATFQLKTDLSDHARGDNYADRYISGLTGTVLASSELRGALGSLAPYPRYKDDPTAALKELQSDVEIEMITQKILDPQTGLERKLNTGFTVTYVNRDPQTAERVASWLANAFTADGRRAAADQVLTESRFYAAEAERQRVKIADSETRLAHFKQENYDRLPETTQANLSVKNINDQDLAGIERDLRAQQQNRTFILQQLQQARAQGPDQDALRALEDEYAKKSAVYDPNHPDMIALRQQINAMRAGGASAGAGSDPERQLAAQQATLAELRQRYSADHPDVKRQERVVQDLQARVASGQKSPVAVSASHSPAIVQLETQLNGVETQISALEQQRAELRNKEANLQNRLQSTPEVERTYEGLNRDATTARQMYDQLNSKRMDAEIRVAAIRIGTVDQFSLVSPPLVPKAPSKPPRVGIAIIGVIGATLLAVMAALAASALDSSVRGSRDLVSLLRITPIAVVPLIRNAEFAQRRRRQLTAFAAAAAILVPISYLVIRFAVP